MRILFISAGLIGDAVLSTGLLAHLLARHPQARFTIAAGVSAAPLFAAFPNLERLVPVRKQRFRLHWASLWREFAAQRWDIAVDLRRSALPWLLRASRRCRPQQDDGSARLRISLLATALGLAADPPRPRLWLTAEDRRRAALLLPGDAPVLALGPTATWPGKMWPADRFAALAGRLTAAGGPLAGARIALLGGPGPGEQGRIAPLAAALPEDRCINLAGRTDLPLAAACLERAALFVGNDSGLMHMAAAVGAPTLGLFGPSRDDHYAPQGPRAAFVRTPESYDELTAGRRLDAPESLMTSLTVDRVAQAALALLG